MKKIIKFIAQDEHVWNVRPKPYPAIKNLPNWWKKIPAYSNDKKQFILNPAPSVTVKKCVPTLDILSAGYYIPLWADVIVEQENKNPVIKWNTNTDVVGVWPQQQASSFKTIDGYSPIFFKNYHGWTIKTPPGWSCLFIHPVAYPDLPFYSISGIVDTDVLNTDINVPFVIKNNFTGIIEKGTPMFQVIPFKRSEWESQFDVKKQNENYFDKEILYSKIKRSYYSLITNKKIYK